MENEEKIPKYDVTFDVCGDIVDIDAIEFPPKVKIRKRNRRLDQLRQLVQGIGLTMWELDGVLNIGFDSSEYISEEAFKTLTDMKTFLSDIADALEHQIAVEEQTGRQE